MLVVIGILLGIAVIANLIFWIMSLIAMKHETLFLVLGIFLPPFAQIGFMLSKRDTIDAAQALTMKRYFISFGIMFVLYIVFATMAASELAQQPGVVG